MTVEVFWCSKCKALMRGKDTTSGPGPDGSILLEARCVTCGGKVYKAVYPEPVEEVIVPSSESELPHGSQRSLGGYPDRPSAPLWAVFVKAVSENLPESMQGNCARVASLVWYEHMTVEQRAALIKEFEETGAVTVPLEDLRFGRKNPALEVRTNPHPLNADAKEVLSKLVDCFWKAKPARTSVYGWQLRVVVERRYHLPREISRIRLVADTVVIADLEFISRDAHFELTLFDGLMYSHKSFRSLVKDPSLVIVGALILLMKRAPVRRLGTLTYKNGILAGKPHHWYGSDPLIIGIDLSQFTGGPLRDINTLELPHERQRSKLPVPDLEKIQRKLEAKTEEYSKYIEAFYEGDPEAAKGGGLDPLAVARLKGDDEYEQLLMVRDMLLSDSEVPKDLVVAALKPSK